MQLDMSFMPEMSAHGFYERDFPLPRKAFCDARWKPAARESGFVEGRKSSFRGANEVSPCPTPVVASPGAGSPESIKDVIYVPGFYEEKSGNAMEKKAEMAAHGGKGRFSRTTTKYGDV
nr:hypothetical protein CFP56_30579 [Quercus suber]